MARKEAATKDFWSLTPRRRMATIAKDIVERLHRNLITPGNTGYITERTGYRDPTDFQSSQEYATSQLASCEVCALGALFLVGVTRGNNYDWRADPGNVQDRVLGWLRAYITSSVQLALIETAYEGRELRWHVGELNKSSRRRAAARAALQFITAYPNRNFRMYAIMRNIVRNKGIFVPAQVKEF